MDDETKFKAVRNFEFMEKVLSEVSDHRFKVAAKSWMAGEGRLDDLLGIVPDPGRPHPAETYWLVKRDRCIQKAGLLCKKNSMRRTILKLINEIELFSTIFSEGRISKPNPLFTDIQNELFFAFKFNLACGQGNFPKGLTTLRKILLSHDGFHSAAELGEHNILHVKWGHDD